MSPELARRERSRVPRRDGADQRAGERTTLRRARAGSCERAARRLAGLGVERGGRVALVLEPSRDYVALLHGLMKLGAVAVPFDPKLTKPELDARLDAIDAALVVRDAAAGRRGARSRRRARRGPRPGVGSLHHPHLGQRRAREAGRAVLREPLLERSRLGHADRHAAERPLALPARTSPHRGPRDRAPQRALRDGRGARVASTRTSRASSSSPSR